jgi:hypothetical protein
MTESKKEVVSVRYDLDERKGLEKKADKLCMSLSEYIRYRSLETEEHINDYKPSAKSTEESRALKFLEYNLPLLYRLLVKSTIKIEHLAMEQLSDDKFNEAQKIEYRIIKDLGVRLEDEDKEGEDKIKW